jgi:hypothetical protein
MLLRQHAVQLLFCRRPIQLQLRGRMVQPWLLCLLLRLVVAAAVQGSGCLVALQLRGVVRQVQLWVRLLRMGQLRRERLLREWQLRWLLLLLRMLQILLRLRMQLQMLRIRQLRWLRLQQVVRLRQTVRQRWLRLRWLRIQV